MKMCTACLSDKPLNEYGKRSASKDGLMHNCKLCCSEAGKSYRANNRDKERIRQAEWARKNPEKAHARNKRWRISRLEEQSKRSREWQIANKKRDAENKKRWRIANPDLVRELRDRWYAARPDRRKEESKTYREKHPDKCRALSSSKRARKVNAVPEWRDKKAIHDIYREARRLSIEKGIKYHVDHVIPLKHPSVCGLHVAVNLQILTAHENMKKYNSFEPG